MADPGMREVIREGGLLLGAGRAVLLQVAHPAVARGVAEHSDFAHRQLDRLRATMTYLYTVAFGTPAERARVSNAVTEVHRTVNGAGYDALDPELQLWVAATLYETGVLLYERWFGQAGERVYQEYRVLGTALQMPDDLWPENRAAFREYWNEMVGTIVVGQHGRQVCQDLLYPKKFPLVVRPVLPFNRFVTAGLLPARIRRGYRLRWDPVRQRRFDRVMAGMAVVYPRIPLWIREYPRRYYLGGSSAADPEAPVS
jgi:uncharacterized protein (DUF2236 family)